MVVADTGLRLVETFDVTFSGFGGDPVHAWLHRPVRLAEPLPVVVRYQGYGGGRGLPHSVGLWPLAGYACLEVDTRGQGAGYSPGETADPSGSGPAHPGYLTAGSRPAAVLLPTGVHRCCAGGGRGTGDPGLDPTRVAVAGGSQGGGIALAVASLRSDLRAVLADVPFLSDFRRASEIATVAPYQRTDQVPVGASESRRQAFAALAYFDAAVLGARASAPALFSVALMDETCPPSTVYAAFHAYGGPKQLRVWPFNDHEGGHAFQEAEQLAFLRAHLG